MPHQISLVNLNAWIGHLPQGLSRALPLESPIQRERRFAALVHELKLRQPDLITLQECMPLPSFAHRLADALGYEACWRVVSGGIRAGSLGLPAHIGRGEGLVILARKELRIRTISVKRLSGFGLVTNWCSLQLMPVRWALAAMVYLHGQRLIVANTHVRYAFPQEDTLEVGWRTLYERQAAKHPRPPLLLRKLSQSNDRARDREMVVLADWLKALSKRHQCPVLLGADLNLDPETPQLKQFIASTGFHPLSRSLPPGTLTWDPDTNPNIHPSIQLAWPDGTPKPTFLQLMAYLDGMAQHPDHMFGSPGLTLLEGSLAFTEPHEGTYASDHYGLYGRWSITRP